MYFIHVFYAPKITPKQPQNDRRRPRLAAAAPSSSLLPLLVNHG